MKKITERLFPDETKSYKKYYFEVPPNTKKIDISYSYEPIKGEEYNNQLTVSIFAPGNIFRGEAHRRKNQEFVISHEEASPGFIKGDLPPGTWELIINIHAVCSDFTVINLDINTIEDTENLKWYKGDLHSHTVHSDGSETVHEKFVNYKEQGLDFFALTDHNTNSGCIEALEKNYQTPLLIHGLELTTFNGHATVIGVNNSWIDWRDGFEKNTMRDTFDKIKSLGGQVTIAHPKVIGGFVCTGCRWEYEDIFPYTANAVEICNGIWNMDYNNEALNLWFGWLNKGIKIYAKAGTDSHSKLTSDIIDDYSFNIVGASSLSIGAILSALRVGRYYLSNGPRLDFFGSNSIHKRVEMGSELTGRNRVINFEMKKNDCEAFLILNGKKINASTEFKIADEIKGWILLIVEKKSRIKAISNPLFL